MELYENIRKLRLEKGMTQSELAEKAGYKDRSIISKIESGKVDLPQSQIFTFAKIFGVDAGDLFGYAGYDELSEDEGKLISIYRNTDEEGKKMISDFAKRMLAYYERINDATTK